MIIRKIKEERAVNDFYSTDPFIIESLLKKEQFDKRILEPAWFIWRKGYKGHPYIDWIF